MKKYKSLFVLCSIFLLFTALQIYNTHVPDHKDTASSQTANTSASGVASSDTDPVPGKHTDIYTVEDWVNFCADTWNENTFKDRYVSLHIDINHEDARALAAERNTRADAYYFSGFFDGNGHTISNVVSEAENQAGLFCGLDEGGTITNLQVINARIRSKHYSGGIVGYLGVGRLINCAAYMIDAQGECSGDICGTESDNIINCSGDTHTVPADELNWNKAFLSRRLGMQMDYWNAWISNGSMSLLTPPTLSENPDFPRVDGDVLTLPPPAIKAIQYRLIDGTELKAVYSDREHSWIGILPAGTKPSCDVTVVWDDNSEVTCTLDELEDIAPFRFLSEDTIPTIVMDTDISDSYESTIDWFWIDKSHNSGGFLSIYDENGRLSTNIRTDKINSRGNSSFTESAKKNLSFSLPNAQNILNLGYGDVYRLVAAHRFDSLLSYMFVADFAREVGMDYVPLSKYVHLFVDGEYAGVYFLTPRIEIGTDRIDIQNIKNNLLDDTGGYILELRNRWGLGEEPERIDFLTGMGDRLVVRNLNKEYAPRTQYIADFWNEFEEALINDTGINSHGKHFTDYIDLKSWANQWIIYHIIKERSVGSSMYYYKDAEYASDDRLHAIYPWDVERSFPDDEFSIEEFSTVWNNSNRYTSVLFSKEEFREVLREQWDSRFVPAIEKALNPETPFRPGSLSYFGDYEKNYYTSDCINTLLWTETGMRHKTELIGRNLKDSLSDIPTMLR